MIYNQARDSPDIYVFIYSASFTAPIALFGNMLVCLKDAWEGCGVGVCP